jgi:ribonucleoside-diphosphate reductase alpha chain
MIWSQPISEDIFKKKYCLSGETTPEEVFHGVAQEVASVEPAHLQQHWQSLFEEEMSSGRLLPGGRILANARPNSKMKFYNNCYTIDIEDSMEGIYQALYEDAQISKSGGGVGFNISKIRPKGDKLSRGGEASGPISFLKVFNESAKIILTGGTRRAAHIAIMNIDHPDIREFITIKKGGLNNELTQFNLSVGISNKFMSDVQADADWALQWGGVVYETVKARELYDLLASHAYEHNEPGVLFLDTVEQYNSGKNYFTMDRSNPCQPAWAKVLTPEGVKTFADLTVGSKIWSKEGWTTVVNKWSTGIKPVYRYATTNGVFYGTENHQVVSNGHKVPIGEADTVETLRGYYDTDHQPHNIQDIMDGLVIGDGSVHKASNNLVYLIIGANDYDYFTSEIQPLLTRDRAKLKKGAYEVSTTIRSEELPKTYERRVPARFITSATTIKSFLRGLFSANGSVCGSRVTLKASSKGLIEDVQLMLSSIGIRSYITTNLSKQVQFSNGSYRCRQSYDLNISADRDKFITSIGFIQHYKNARIPIEAGKDRHTDSDVREVTFVAEEEVWDITVDNESHTYWTQGLNVSNCGEVVMPAYSLCCLASLNLTKFIVDAFTDTVYFDFDAFNRSISIGVRFLDNVLDATQYPLERIEEFSRQWRRIGLGFTGLGDAFAMMKLVYGEVGSLELSHKIGQALRDTSYRTSMELAKEKGQFAAFKTDIAETGFILTLPNDIQKDIRQHGLRNIALNTCAPTGTISLSLGNNCSSGIEPIFSLHYDRNIRTGRGDETRKETVYDDAWLKYRAKAWEQTPENTGVDPLIPPFFVTSQEVDPYAGIDVQAIFQKYIDHSISKTASLPKEYSYEDYKGLWQYAFNSGLKGFTSYNPSGSLKGILEHKEPEKPVDSPVLIDRHHAPKRPVELPCDIHEITVEKNKFVVAIGTYFGALYEVFLVDNNEGLIDVMKYKEGVIKKVGKGKYDLIVKNGVEKILIDNISKFSGGLFGSLSRMVSMSLRHGVPLEFIVETLQKSTGFDKFDKVVARVLKKYIRDGEKVQSSKVCLNCGSEDLIYEGGCVVCKQCGNSACS